MMDLSQDDESAFVADPLLCWANNYVLMCDISFSGWDVLNACKLGVYFTELLVNMAINTPFEV